YLYLGTDQEYWALDKDFPNIAPPWPLAYYAWNEPVQSFSNGQILNRDFVKHFDFGCLVMGYDLRKLPDVLPSHVLNMVNRKGELVDRSHIPDNARWATNYVLFTRFKETQEILWQEASFFVGDDGSYAGVKTENPAKHEFFVTPMSVWPKVEHDM